MKKILFALIFVTFLFGCKSEEGNNDDNTPNDTVIVDQNKAETTEIILSEEEIDVKADEILKESEDINNKLDEILNN